MISGQRDQGSTPAVATTCPRGSTHCFTLHLRSGLDENPMEWGYDPHKKTKMIGKQCKHYTVVLKYIYGELHNKALNRNHVKLQIPYV